MYVCYELFQPFHLIFVYLFLITILGRRTNEIRIDLGIKNILSHKNNKYESENLSA